MFGGESPLVFVRDPVFEKLFDEGGEGMHFAGAALDGRDGKAGRSVGFEFKVV